MNREGIVGQRMRSRFDQSKYTDIQNCQTLFRLSKGKENRQPEDKVNINLKL